jgi:hypothetical protein
MEKKPKGSEILFKLRHTVHHFLKSFMHPWRQSLLLYLTYLRTLYVSLLINI